MSHSFLGELFWPPNDFDISANLAEILSFFSQFLTVETLRSRRDITRNLAKILGKFLATEILISR